MTFQTETVLSCSVPPSSRGFERLNTERDRGIGALAAGRPDDSPAWREIAYLSRHAAAGGCGRLLPMPRRAAGERGDRGGPR